MNGLVARDGPERQHDERGVDDEDGDAADVVNPFAEFEAANRCGGDGENDSGDDKERDEMVFRQPRRDGTDEVGQFGGDSVEDGCGDSDAVEPEVPCGHEAAEIAERGARPDVEAAFERHLAVEIDD